MRLLIGYATTDGQTRKVAEYCADHLRHGPALVDVGPVAGAGRPAPEAFDAIILAGSVHFDRFQRALVNFSRDHADTLSERPTLLLVVSLTAALGDERDRAKLERDVAAFTRRCGWTPGQVAHVAGAIRFSQYGLARRWLVRAFAARRDVATNRDTDIEYTDFASLDAVLDDWMDGLPSATRTE